MTTPTVEERIANLEGSFAQIATRLDRVEIDIRDLRTEMNTRFDQLQRETNARFDQMERQFTSRLDQVTSRFDQMQQETNSRFEQMQQEHQTSHAETIRRLDSIDQKIDRINERIDRTNQRIDKMFYFILGLIAANGAVIITILLTD